MITSLSVNRGGLGRTGNQMFTIAGTIGIALKNGQPFGFPEWINKDAELFGGTADRMSDYFVNPLPELIEGLHYQDIPYHWEYRDYNIQTGNWNIRSHLQDPRYFENCMPLIRHYFRMKDEPEQNEYIALHYRAGDYIDNPDAYHPRCSPEYYREAMKQFYLMGCKFLVFTDSEMDWVRVQDQIGLPKGVDIQVASRRMNYIEHFRLMKRCKHFITANSSFSLFAAILGEHPEKKIICPKRWFGTAAGGMEFYGYPKDSIIL